MVLANPIYLSSSAAVSLFDPTQLSRSLTLLSCLAL